MKTERSRSLAALAFLAVACGGGGGGDGSSSAIVTNLSSAVCDPTAGPFTLSVTNPFFPLPVGHELVLDGTEDGEAVHLVITVLDQVVDVAGVPTRVVEERESTGGELSEVSRNFFAQAPDGTVCYFGEDVDIYESGAIVSHEGQWRASVDGASPGIIMPGSPSVGDAYAQENAPGVAEDRAEVTSQSGDTLETREDSAIESGTSTKVYARGVGLVKDDTLELTSAH